ncbi:hypothetical protein EVAR_59300_1 [Eumeta japonica]|uniref:Uncharacterized protein n=1 Tax=Eumeta variegata TaxID=151549 RepID=A0A4C1Y938_EUMVA|nr:hypothetical protein EVAR_59300_1 [Eumeta japonica]
MCERACTRGNCRCQEGRCLIDCTDRLYFCEDRQADKLEGILLVLFCPHKEFVFRAPSRKERAAPRSGPVLGERNSGQIASKMSPHILMNALNEPAPRLTTFRPLLRILDICLITCERYTPLYDVDIVVARVAHARHGSHALPPPAVKENTKTIKLGLPATRAHICTERLERRGPFVRRRRGAAERKKRERSNTPSRAQPVTERTFLALRAPL